MDGTVVHLVRHAAHDRVDGVLCGRMPGVTLSEPGRAQARRLAERFAAERPAALYASPIERARDTAGPIGRACGLPVRIEDGWTEIDVGEWTGRTFSELDADPRWRDWNGSREAGCPPGGEPMRAVADRVAAALERLREAHPGGRVVAVSHADVIKAAICRVLGLSLDRLGRFEIAPASVSTLVLWPGGGKVVALNDAAAS